MQNLKLIKTSFFLFILTYLINPILFTVNAQSTVQPLYVTEAVKYDTDDPAIWINKENPSESLIIGTDKEADGALFVFNLQGQIIPDKVIPNLERPNNVDVAYGLMLQGAEVDIAVTTERLAGKLRVYSLPDMQAVDSGGIEVFEGESGSYGYDEPMGVSLYKRPSDGSLFAIVSRKSGTSDGTYLWQYLLEDDGQGNVTGTLVRKFGNYSGNKEIEAVAVDNELGYVYYSDEMVGVRKYYADPDSSNEELALFATSSFSIDQEGIAIYNETDSTGFILVSDQDAGELHLYPREGTAADPHQHPLLKEVPIAARFTDGIEATSHSLPPDFNNGLVVAMSEGGTFHLYRWEDIAGDDIPTDTSGTTTEEEIISFNSTWKYLDDGSDQDTAWQEASFNDSGWKSGEGKLGYGIPDAATVVSYGKNKNKKYITSYFRKNFSITDLEAISSFTAQVNRDDGVVIYVNGQEVYRNNMPSGAISYSTLAAGTTGGDDGATPIPFSIPITAFVNGSNTIAVEIHQAARSSSDIAFDLELIGSKAVPLGTKDTNASNSSTSFETEADLISELKAYPNPFSGSVTISFTSAANTTYSVSLYDSNGKQVGVTSQGTAEKGRTTNVAVDGTNLAAGLYFVRVETNYGKYTFRLININ
ncbi:phytase [uncultured Pontibacter sp.]|uniref:phytase n=1 Tax=uncultured Pontibacter sp. TaxID=453356 RepID=UPI002635DE57|nr:phytase [uncultured Pontibacter sp.]